MIKTVWHNIILTISNQEQPLEQLVIIALSNVRKHNIETLYPLVNGPKDLAARTMNTMITPSSGLTEDKPMKIMWTHTLSKTPSAKKSWTPNHLIPLIDDPKILHKGKSAKTSTPADKAASVIFIPKHPTQGDRPWRTQIGPNHFHQYVLWRVTSIASTVLKILVRVRTVMTLIFNVQVHVPALTVIVDQQDSSNHPREGKPTREKEQNHNAHHVQLEKNSWTPVFKMSQIFAFLAQDRVIMKPLFRKTHLRQVLLILRQIALELGPSLDRLLLV